MIISIASDHGGFELKEHLKAYLEKDSYTIIDEGTFSEDSVDYPDFAKKTALDILSGKAEKGIIICGTGIGVTIAANRFKGIRAALVHNEDYAKLSREHNNANIITLGGRFLKKAEAEKIVDIFLSTEFLGGRHQSRIDKLDTIC